MNEDRGKGRISPRDLLLREGALSNYLATQVAQSACFVNVIRLNFNTFYLPYSSWASALASLQHRMEARSALLFTMAQRDGKDMDVIQSNYWKAYTICCAQCEERND